MSSNTRIHKNAYGQGNSGTMLDYLQEIILILNGEKGRQPIQETYGGYQDIEVANSVIQLSVPENAYLATLMIEANPNSSDLNRVVRFKENGSDPTVTSGILLGDRDIYEITGKEQMEAFRCIALESGVAHFLRVQYYKSTADPNGKL